MYNILLLGSEIIIEIGVSPDISLVSLKKNGGNSPVLNAPPLIQTNYSKTTVHYKAPSS